MIIRFTIYFLLFCLLSITKAQWSGNPSVNLTICDVTGDQVQAKISPTTDGGCYISWFDNRSGNYAVYLQRVDALGKKRFAANGLLISNNPQSYSLVDYDLKTDANNNAIIVFSDTRNGGNINPYAYSISPSGTFLWGNNGVSLSNSVNTYQPNPKIALTSNGAYVFTWIFGSSPIKVALQKLNSSGVKQWGNNPIFLGGGGSENFTYPDMVPSNNGSIILLWSGYTGTFLNPGNYRLYSQKFSPSGHPLWNSTMDTVYGTGYVSGSYVPRIFMDGNNGAIYCWRDYRGNVNYQTGYIQRANSSGTFLFPVNGSAVSTLTGNNHFDPVACLSQTGETYVIWLESNNQQNQWGLSGQKFSTNGSREWTDNGHTFLSLNNNQSSNMSIYSRNGSMIAYYIESQSGSNNLIKSFICDANGNLGWGDSIITPCSLLSPKIKLNVTQNSAGMSMLAWQDNRNDGGGIYAQNVNFDGTFGNPTGIKPISNEAPDKFSLEQNYPNPFNPSTNIKFNIPPSPSGEGEVVTLKIYDILGREVATLVNQNLQPGNYEVKWDAKNFSSGMYFYKLTSGNNSEVKKMLLIK